MKFSDPAYGRFEIGHRVLEDVISTGAVQRLRKINQYGAWQFILPRLKTSRFDHCVGVCHLLGRLGASLEEQVAGLAHEVSHTAFSHVTDYLYQDGEQEQSGQLFEKALMGSEIPAVLRRYGISPKSLLETSRFRLLERELPDLCADRLDCFFRDSVLLGICTQDHVRMFLRYLTKEEGEIMVMDSMAAKKMSLAFLECSRKLWASPTQAASYKIMADAIRHAMMSRVVSRDDFFLTDQELYRKMRDSGNPNVVSRLEMITPSFFAVRSPQKYDFFVKPGTGCIDPKVLHAGNVSRLSEIDPEYKALMDQSVEKASQGYFVRVFPGRKQGMKNAYLNKVFNIWQ
jgi:HD superfamily phosphohydrolase